MLRYKRLIELKKKRTSHGKLPGHYQYENNVIITVKESGRLWYILYDYNDEDPSILYEYLGKCYYKSVDGSIDFGDFKEWGPSSNYKTLIEVENHTCLLPQW